MLRVTTNVDEVIRDFDKLSNGLESMTDEIATSYASQVKSIAKKNHRFKNKSGRLISAVSTRSANRSDGKTVKVTIDHGRAPYAYYVHEGHRGWSPDKFLYKALDAVSNRFESWVKGPVDKWIK